MDRRESESTLKSERKQETVLPGSSFKGDAVDATIQKEIRKVTSSSQEETIPSSAQQSSEQNRQRQREIEDAMKADYGAAGAASGRQELIEAVFERKRKLETSPHVEQSDPFAVESHPLSLSVDEVLQAEMIAAKALISTESPDPAEKSKMESSGAIADPLANSNGPTPTAIPSPSSIGQVLQAEMEAAKTLKSTKPTSAADKVNAALAYLSNLTSHTQPGRIASDAPLSAISEEGLHVTLGSLSVDEVLQAEMRAAKALLSTEFPDPAEKSKMDDSDVMVYPLTNNGASSSAAIPSPLSIDQVLQAEMEVAKSLQSSTETTSKIDSADFLSLVEGRGIQRKPSLSNSSEKGLLSDSGIGKKVVHSKTTQGAKPSLDAKTSIEGAHAVQLNSTPENQASPAKDITGASKRKGNRQRQRKRQNRKGNQNNNKAKNDKGGMGNDGM